MNLFSAFSFILICTLYIGNVQARRFLADGSPLDNLIQSILTNITNYRRDFHKYPEVGMDLTQTHDKLVRYLSGIGTIRTMYQVGIVVDIVGQGPPRGNPFTIALRSDMDALLMAEDNQDLPWRSVNAGKDHSCGHDGHMSCLVGAALILKKVKNNLPRDVTVRLIFEPDEEGDGGAIQMIKEGCMEKVNEVYSMHYESPAELGLVITRPGVIYSHYSSLSILVKGKAGHSAKPQQSIDPILIASQITVALQGVITKYLDPTHSGVLSICKFHGGTSPNQIPSEVLLEGNTRDMSKEDFEIIKTRVIALSTSIAEGYGGTAIVTFVESDSPAVINNPDNVNNIIRAAGKAGLKTKIGDPLLTSESVGSYFEVAPGAVFFLGGGTEGIHRAGNHNPLMDFNDELLPLCTKMWVTLLEDRIGVKLFNTTSSFSNILHNNEKHFRY